MNLYGWIKTRTRAKSEDMIAFVPSICPSIDHPQFALIQTLVKTTAKPAKPLAHNLVSNRFQHRIIKSKSLFCTVLQFIYFCQFYPDQGFSNVCLISNLHKFSVIIFHRQIGGISARQEISFGGT